MTTNNNSVMYYHDEVTHPGEVHKECVCTVTSLVSVTRTHSSQKFSLDDV